MTEISCYFWMNKTLLYVIFKGGLLQKEWSWGVFTLIKVWCPAQDIITPNKTRNRQQNLYLRLVVNDHKKELTPSIHKHGWSIFGQGPPHTLVRICHRTWKRIPLPSHLYTFFHVPPLLLLVIRQLRNTHKQFNIVRTSDSIRNFVHFWLMANWRFK